MDLRGSRAAHCDAEVIGLRKPHKEQITNVKGRSVGAMLSEAGARTSQLLADPSAWQMRTRQERVSPAVVVPGMPSFIAFATTRQSEYGAPKPVASQVAW